MSQIGTIVRTVFTSGRWRRSLGLALLFAVLCAGLSWWQFWRAAQTSAANHLIESNWNAAPQPIDAVLRGTSSAPASKYWLPVLMHGTYLVDKQMLVRNRSLEGVPGFEVLTPLKLDSGRVFVVDRGFVRTSPTNDGSSPVPAPPAGQVTVTARLQPSEPLLVGRGAPAGQVPDIYLPDVAAHVGQATYTGVYGWVDTESPAVDTMPTPLEQPSLDTGMNLSYAIQWIAFALIGFVALGLSVRQDLRDANDPDVELADLVRRSRRTPTDAEIEDAQIEATLPN